MIYDRFYDTSEKTLYFQCFWPFFRGFKSRLAHQNPRELRLPGVFLSAAKKRRSPKRDRRRFFYAPKHVNMMTRYAI